MRAGTLPTLRSQAQSDRPTAIGIRGRLRRALFGIARAEVTCARRGFAVESDGKRAHLEAIGTAFLHGYHAALDSPAPAATAVSLSTVDPVDRGFAHEGAAMAFALLDLILPGSRSRLHRFIAVVPEHVYTAHVGCGWALAHLRVGEARLFDRLDAVLRWLAMDGYGFHEGYFRPGRDIAGSGRRRRLSAYGRRAFDQGLGRSLWFSCGADVRRIAAAIAQADQSRREDLWSGVGLASTYAGGMPDHELNGLVSQAGGFRPALCQGAMFAAEARARGSFIPEHTERACRIICGVSAESASTTTQRASRALPADADVPAYEVWRARVRAQFA